METRKWRMPPNNGAHFGVLQRKKQKYNAKLTTLREIFPLLFAATVKEPYIKIYIYMYI